MLEELQAIRAMSKDERDAEIARLRSDHAEALAAPRMMDGNISPAQVGMMSVRQKAQWQRRVSERFDVEAQIANLSATDEELDHRINAILEKKRSDRAMQLESLIEAFHHFRGKNGKVLPKYQREIAKAQAELASL